MLSYVFWHWPRSGVDADEYEARQRAFHAALAEVPPTGFLGSRCAAVAGAPWTPDDAYEDWYRVEDFAALGTLNDAAVSGARAEPHRRAAELSADGAGGLYRLRHGTPLDAPGHAHWFSKPRGRSYDRVLAELSPTVDRTDGALWVRQLVLGPGRELCLRATTRVELPEWASPLLPARRPVWPKGRRGRTPSAGGGSKG